MELTTYVYIGAALVGGCTQVIREYMNEQRKKRVALITKRLMGFEEDDLNAPTTQWYLDPKTHTWWRNRK